MEGVQRFIANHKNSLLAATSIAGPVKSITDAVIKIPGSRNGSSAAALGGTFAGSEEADYEVEIVSTTPVVALVTEPVFTGAGNGALTGIAATSLSARTITIELADLGNVLTAASALLQDVKVIARTPGAAGNNFKFRINRSGLTHTQQGFSLLNQLPENTKSVKGPEYDWNTAAILGDDTVPVTANRISFGEDRNNVYVQYKAFVDGGYTYYFEPAIKQRVPVGTPVNFVTGTYTVQLLDGVTVVETYNGIVTLFDLLNAIKTTSTRLLVQGAIAADRLPGGASVADLQLTTDAYAISNNGTGSSYAAGFTDVSISASAATELITATCFAAKPKDAQGAGLGQEFWEIKGSVSGLISSKVVSGDLISTPAFVARIPRKVPNGYNAAIKGTFVVKDIAYADRSESESKPGICPTALTLGVNAEEKLITLTYTKRPVKDDCACDFTGGPLNPDCLGLVTTTGGSTVAYQSDTVTRLKDLYSWQATVVKDNSSYLKAAPGAFTSVLDPSTQNGVGSGGYGHLTAAGQQDPFISNPAQGSAQRISGYSDAGVTFIPTIAPTLTGYAKASLLKIVADYEKAIALIDKLPAGTLRTDGMAAWDVAVTELKNDVAAFMTDVPSSQTESIVAEEALTANTWVLVYEPNADGTKKCRPAVGLFDPVGNAYFGFVTAGVSSGANATVYRWGTFSTVVKQDGGCSTNTATFPGMVVRAAKNCVGLTAPYTSSGGAPLYTLSASPLAYVTKPGATAADPSLLFVPRQGTSPVGMQLLPDRYNTRLSHALISAGISPLGKSDADNDSGDGCWRDEGGEYWWVITTGDDDGYAPAFSNIPYYSAKKTAATLGDGGFSSSGGQYNSTKEFGFIVNVKCPEKLKEGDTVTLAIGAAGMEPTYSKGDTLVLGIVAAQDIPFSGGKDGDNVQTWYVTDSVAGPRAPYALDTDTPAAYVDGSLTFLVNQGTLPFAKGDKFTFSIEGGTFRWRKIVAGVAGAWSGAANIVTTPIALDSGLSLTFTPGSSPAFATSDVYKFKALQPYALSNLKKPDFLQWQWGVSPAQLTVSWATPVDINAIALGFHTIPQSATVLVEYSSNGGVSYAPLATTLQWRKDCMAGLVSANSDMTMSMNRLRITITGAPDGAIGWLFVGEYTAMTASAEFDLNLQYQVKVSPGDYNPASVYLGRGKGGRIVWPEGYLNETDFAELESMLNYLKENDNQPLMVLLQSTRQDILMVYVDSNDIEVKDVFSFQPASGYSRRLSATLPVNGVTF